MSLRVAEAFSRIAVAGQSVSRVVVAGVNVWESFKPYSVSSGGSQVLTSGSWATLDQRTVGHGPGRISISWSYANDGLQWLSFDRSIRILVNGSEVWRLNWSGSGGWSDNGTYDGDFQHGDTVAYQAYTSGTGRELARTLNSWSLSATAR